MNLRRRLLLAVIAAWPLATPAAPLYPDVSRASADIEAALAEAGRQGRRVLVDFGGDWCTDCKVLDTYMRRPENAAILASRYVLVHVNVGVKGITDNFDVAARYGIVLAKGVPAFAVLEPGGRLVFSQKAGEFESMRSMNPRSVTEFLVKWQGPK